ncbi:MAG: carnitine operon protein CaiE [Gammaproteobacteria bacterium]
MPERNEGLTVYSIEGVTPVVHPDAYVHPSAVLIGDVIIGAGVYVGPGASLRGDLGRVEIGAGSNIQDNCIVHGFPGGLTVVEEEGHIAHGAVLHGCRVHRNALVGMNAVVMDDAEIGESAIVAAMALVTAGTQVPPRHLLTGVPGRVVRELKPEELAWKREATAEYQHLTVRCLSSLQPTSALPEEERERPRLNPRGVAPLHESKGKNHR